MTCNTIAHPSNAIDVTAAINEAVQALVHDADGAAADRPRRKGDPP